MLSFFKRRIAGLKEQLAAARRTADEMVERDGEKVWEGLSELQFSARKRSAYREYLFWKVTGEYVRDLTKRRR